MSAKGYLIAFAAVITCAALWFGRPQARSTAATSAPIETITIDRPHVAPAPARSPQSAPAHVKAPYFTNEEREKLLSDFKAQHTSRLREIFSDFWPVINATPETQNAITDLLVSRDMELFAKSVAPENGVGATPASPAQIAEAQAAAQKKLRELLGEEKAAALASYQRTIPERRMIKQFNRLAGKVSREVQEQLLSIALEESAKTSVPAGLQTHQEISAHLDEQTKRKQMAIIARAAEILDDQQLILLRQAMKSDDRAAARLAK